MEIGVRDKNGGQEKALAWYMVCNPVKKMSEEYPNWYYRNLEDGQTVEIRVDRVEGSISFLIDGVDEGPAKIDKALISHSLYVFVSMTTEG